MSFDNLEKSIAEGRPLRLYRFSRGSLAWRYTSGTEPVTHAGETYAVLEGGIIDDGIRQTGQASADQVTITAPADAPVAQLYREMPPFSEVALTMFARHVGDNGYLACWSGSVRAVKWPSFDRCEIVCSPLSSRMTMTGLRLTWGRACPYALYSRACGVVAADWGVAGAALVVDGVDIQVAAAAAYANGYFTAGYVEWRVEESDVLAPVFERRGIRAHTDNRLTLLSGTAGMPGNVAVTLYPGCQQSVEGCKGFGNLGNYGGFPHLPGVSPFDGRNPF
jgi:uncharacterized phage protein (TIGR02218 family)